MGLGNVRGRSIPHGLLLLPFAVLKVAEDDEAGLLEPLEDDV